MFQKITASARFLAPAIPYLLLLAGAYSVFCVTTDDPFITYRYAANVLAGHGPVFNVGEWVEGYSSPLHLLLIVLLLKIVPSVDILFQAKVIGIALAALALWQTGRLAHAVGLSAGEGLLAQILVAANTNLALAAVNGLETTLFLCLLLAATQAFLREIQGRGGPQSAAWLFLALLARPETMLIYAALLVVRVICAARGRLPWQGVAGWAAIFPLWAAGRVGFSFAYYGQLVANTYYAKQVTWERGWQEGLLYLNHPLSPVGLVWDHQPWQILGTVVFWGLAAVGGARLGAKRVGGVLLAVVLAQVVFVLRFGGDWMPGWRFLVPVLPLLTLLQVHGLRLLRRPSSSRPGWAQAAAPALTGALWLVCAGLAPHNPWSNAHFSTASQDLLPADNKLGRKWVAVDRYIQTSLPPGSRIAYSEMGYAGYCNLDKTFIDVRGLTDREIARLPAVYHGVVYKGTWGVDDEQWMYPEDPLYQILDRRQPTAIIAFSHPLQMPPVVLDHYYFCATIRDGRDSDWSIEPALVYRPR